jgi:ankyrin repeat protein
VAKAPERIAKLLLDAGADPNAKTKSWSQEIDAVYLAVNAGQASTLKLLLERGANATGALPPALWRQDMRLAEIAMKYGAQPDKAVDDSRPVLNNLVRWGRIEGALWLLGRGASPNLADAEGWTAVHQAASRGNLRIMEALLNAGGDPTRTEKQGYTPLDIARVTGKSKMIDLLAKSSGGPLQRE